MSTRIHVSIFVALAVLFIMSGPASAISEAGAWLPPADAFGIEWDQTDMSSVDLYVQANPGADLIRDQAIGVYVGPHGARIVVTVFLVAQDQTVTRQAWETIGNLLIGAMLTMSPDDFAIDQSAVLPDGCAEGKRQTGTVLAVGNVMTGIPVAATLCAVEPDVLILIETSGTIDGESGIAAADAVLVAILASGPNQLGTPVADM